MSQLQFIDFSSSLWAVYSCPLCLVIFGWMWSFNDPNSKLLDQIFSPFSESQGLNSDLTTESIYTFHHSPVSTFHAIQFSNRNKANCLTAVACAQFSAYIKATLATEVEVISQWVASLMMSSWYFFGQVVSARLGLSVSIQYSLILMCWCGEGIIIYL